LSNIYRLIILTDGKPKGMTVSLANDEPCDLEQMKIDAISKFNAERVISVTEKKLQIS
jgi:hypothetical protein